MGTIKIDLTPILFGWAMPPCPEGGAGGGAPLVGPGSTRPGPVGVPVKP